LNSSNLQDEIIILLKNEFKSDSGELNEDILMGQASIPIKVLLEEITKVKSFKRKIKLNFKENDEIGYLNLSIDQSQQPDEITRHSVQAAKGFGATRPLNSDEFSFKKQAKRENSDKIENLLEFEKEWYYSFYSYTNIKKQLLDKYFTSKKLSFNGKILI